MDNDLSKGIEIDINHDESKYIVLEIANQKVKIPNWYSIKAEKNYFNSYEVYKNYRKAFCSLVYTMIDKANDKEKTGIKVEDVELFSDNELIKIINNYLDDYKELNTYFKEVFKEDYFEAFYLMLKKQESEIGKQLSESVGNLSKKISDSIEPIIKSIGNMRKLTLPAIESATEKLIKENKSTLKYDLDSMPLVIKHPQHKTNELLSELNNSINNLRNNEREYQLQNNEYSIKMVELLSKEQEAREKLEQETKKIDKRNYRGTIITILIAALTLIATIVGIIITLCK